MKSNMPIVRGSNHKKVLITDDYSGPGIDLRQLFYYRCIGTQHMHGVQPSEGQQRPRNGKERAIQGLFRGSVTGYSRPGADGAGPDPSPDCPSPMWCSILSLCS